MGPMARLKIANILFVLFLLAPALLGQDKKDEKADAVTEKPAVITFRLREDAKLLVDGKEYKKHYGSTERKFETPPLKPGTRYSYNAEAVWEPNNYTKIRRPRKVIVEAGKSVEVDFTSFAKNKNGLLINMPKSKIDVLMARGHPAS